MITYTRNVSENESDELKGIFRKIEILRNSEISVLTIIHSYNWFKMEYEVYKEFKVKENSVEINENEFDKVFEIVLKKIKSER